MATIQKRPLTKEEQASAARLKAAWNLFQTQNKGYTQEWLAGVTGLGKQSVIGQYLNGTIQLNVKALLAICNEIGADPAVISPTLAAQVKAFPPKAEIPQNRQQELVYADPDEITIMTLYRLATPMGKQFILDMAEKAEKSKQDL